MNVFIKVRRTRVFVYMSVLLFWVAVCLNVIRVWLVNSENIVIARTDYDGYRREKLSC